MKRILVLIISLFLIPALVNAKTFTFDVCDTCEYTKLSELRDAMLHLSYLNGEDIIININSDLEENMTCNLAFSEKIFKSLTINGNNYTINKFSFETSANNIIVKNIKTTQESSFSSYNPKKISIENSEIKQLTMLYYDLNTGKVNTQEIKLKEVLEIDNVSKNNLKIFTFLGSAVIDNMDLSNHLLYLGGGITNIYNSKLSKILVFPILKNIEMNIYNSEFASLRFKNVQNLEDNNEIGNCFQHYDLSVLAHDIYNIDLSSSGGQTKSDIKIYFDKESEIKVNDKINLVDYLDYYTDEKEISYTIEDESIAKIENKELIGLKPGNTKVQVTTDEGHVVYNIDLTVYTISEKKVTMKAQNKLKLNSVFKDLDVSSVNDDVWEISNPKVAKIVNGEIISLQKGETDIVATINGVKYIYHLTVGDTLVSKEIKVPITGKSIKLWIVIVGILLLSVIGVCTYMLLKSKKAE